MANEFDELLRSRFDEGDFDVAPGQWEGMVSLLDGNQKTGKGRFWLFFTASAMAASLAFAFALFYRPSSTTTPSSMETPIVSFAKPSLGEKATLQQETKGIVYTASHPALKKERIAIDNPGVPAKAHDNIPAPALSDNVVIPDKGPETAVTGVQPTVRPEISDDRFMNAHKAKQDVKAAFSLAGGINQGSLNTGYALGVSARTRLGSKFYLEGDLAYNTNGNTSISTRETDIGSSSISPQKVMVSSVSNFSYLQFSPSVGYQLTRKLSFSLGGDIQKLISSQDREIFIGDAGREKQVPGLDYGVTGKAEVRLSKRLTAGLLYREGINNIVRGNASYFDRRYLQVQLKFRVIGK
jgi:hypothetical protein